jgi:hypothetical protein
VREGEEHDVHCGEHGGRGLLQDEMRERDEVRVDSRQRLPGVLVRGDDGHLELGMRGEQPEQLSAGVSARAGDGYSQCRGTVGHGSTFGSTGRGSALQ